MNPHRPRPTGLGAGRSVLVPLLGAGAVLALLAALAGGSAAVAAENPAPDGVNITVTVGPGSGTAVAPPAAGTTSNTTTRTTVNGDVVVTGPEVTPAVADDEQSIGGILYISGLGTAYAPSIDPLSGDLQVHFTVRNVSNATIDSTARFWVSNPFGGEISAVGPVDVAGLKPDESRVVDATLSGVGQWTFATAHVTLTPPETVDGVELAPLTRDAFVFLPPWFLLALAAIGAAAYAVVRLIRAGSAVPGAVAAGAAAEPALAESTA